MVDCLDVTTLLNPVHLGDLAIDPPLLLAPMAGYTNHAFRLLCRQEGGCGLTFSELVSARALRFRSSRSRTLDLLDWRPEEGPVAVQLFGSEPVELAEAARVVVEAGARVVDLNMGCWVPKVARQGGGAALLRDPEKAREVMRAVVEGLPVPVTVKLRAGWGDGEATAERIARAAAECGVAAVTVHGRTASEGFAGPADWEAIARVVRAVPGLPVIGNGDVGNAAQARQMMQQTGCAGVMIGRAALGAPWLFRQVEHELRTGQPLPPPDRAGRAAVAWRHARLTLATTRLPAAQAVQELRGQLSRYQLDLPGQSCVRDALVRARSLEDLQVLLEPLAGGETAGP